MFERYTEKARRVIYFARYEASQFGVLAIEPEHVLLAEGGALVAARGVSTAAALAEIDALGSDNQ